MRGVPSDAGRDLTLPDGERVRLRAYTPADAAAVYDYHRRIRPTTDTVLTMADEMGPLATYRKRQDDACSAEGRARGCLYLLAETTGETPQIVGDADLYVRDRRKIHHVAELGIMLAPSYRGRGLGTAMMRELIAWSRAHPRIEKIQLAMLASNDVGRRLYEGLGFTLEGRRQRTFRQPDGTLVDEILYGMWIGAEP